MLYSGEREGHKRPAHTRRIRFEWQPTSWHGFPVSDPIQQRWSRNAPNVGANHTDKTTRHGLYELQDGKCIRQNATEVERPPNVQKEQSSGIVYGRAQEQ